MITASRRGDIGRPSSRAIIRARCARCARCTIGSADDPHSRNRVVILNWRIAAYGHSVERVVRWVG